MPEIVKAEILDARDFKNATPGAIDVDPGSPRPGAGKDEWIGLPLPARCAFQKSDDFGHQGDVSPLASFSPGDGEERVLRIDVLPAHREQLPLSQARPERGEDHRFELR